MKIKLLFLIYTITDYQISFFNFLKKLNLFEVRIFFYNKKYNNYNFKYKKKKYFSFIEDYSNKKKFLITEINKFTPDFLIFGGYKLKYYSFILSIIKKKNIRYFFWLERLDKRRIIKNKILDFFIRRRLQNSNGIICVGKEAKNFYKRYNNKVYNLPYSIDVNKINRKLFFKDNKINFLFIGQLIKRKGADLLLSVLKKLAFVLKEKALFTIVGNGNLEKFFSKISKVNSNIKYYNFKNQSELRKIYLNHDVLIYPSRFDGWGVVPMEAMSYSLFLIISKNCGVLEILKKTNNYLINSHQQEIERSILQCIESKKRIKKQGILNKKIISQSICNNKNLESTVKNIFNK